MKMKETSPKLEQELERPIVQIEMFEAATIIETEDGKVLDVPPRTIDFGECGIWKVDVRGRSAWFKERDDYGSKRVTSSGRGLWIPHIYAFEETDEKNLPEILDQERMKVWLTVDRVVDGSERPLYDYGILLGTNSGRFGAPRSIDAWACGEIDRYDWFFNLDGTSYIEDMDYDDPTKRKKIHTKSTCPQGQLWIPVSVIGSVSAEITFPMFDKRLRQGL